MGRARLVLVCNERTPAPRFVSNLFRSSSIFYFYHKLMKHKCLKEK